MTNYSKTRELISKEPKKSPDLKYKDTFPAGFFGEEMAEERWFSQVKNPNTGEFFQLENLKALGILDEGTIVDISKLPDRLGGNRQIWIRWERYDGGNTTVAMIEGEDRFEMLD